MSHCLLVVPGCAADPQLLRDAKHLANALQLGLAVIDVQVLAFGRIRDGDYRPEVARAAQDLDVELVRLRGASAAGAVAGYARRRQAPLILVGIAPIAPSSGLRALSQYARTLALRRLPAALRRRLPAVEIITLHGRREPAAAPAAPAAPVQPAPAAAPRPARRPARMASLLAPARIRDYSLGMLITALCTLAAAAVLTPSYLVTFTAMLIVALVIANLIIAVRKQSAAAAARQRHTAALYALARKLTVAHDASAMMRIALRHVGEVLQCHAHILLCDASGQLAPAEDSSAWGDARPQFDLQVARWVAAQRSSAGQGTSQFPSEPCRYLPLLGAHGTVGVLLVELPAQSRLPSADRQLLLEAIADQLALALERARMSELAHTAQITAERAATRNTLLASISHDLRTPLSAIAGAGSMMAQRDFALDLYRRVTLGRLIESKARDMADLLTNVLELIRLESGGELLLRDWHALPDLVDRALRSHEGQLAGRQVVVDLPGALPSLPVDDHLIVQLLGNLLQNAVKYTPPGALIRICAGQSKAGVTLSVEDNGPGFGAVPPEILFEKFARGRSGEAVGGVGLGLTICRAIARLHGGEIQARRSAAGGARFEVTLPLASAEQSEDLQIQTTAK